MTNTYARVQADLIRVLADKDNKVVALSGKWGTGKTTLWDNVAREVFKQNQNQSVVQPINVSLFGAKSITELKLRILQNLYSSESPSLNAALKSVSSFANGVLTKFTGVSAEENALTWLPKLVSGRLIVIDDVERKHKSMDIDEFLGLLNEYSEVHSLKFVILLNTDKLSNVSSSFPISYDASMWATLHEKVIDVELILNPSPGEAFDVFALGKSNPNLAAIRAAIVKLNVSNIRVIARVVKTVQRICEAGGNVNVPVERWIPSTTLLTAAHYRAVENAPPIDFLLSFNALPQSYLHDAKQRSAEEDGWIALLEKLGIDFADDFEQLIHEYLGSGLLDEDRLKSIFSQYERDAANAETSAKLKTFHTAIYLDPQTTKDKLLAMANALLPAVVVMNPVEVSDLIDAVQNLGATSLATQFLENWRASAPSRPEYQKLDQNAFDNIRRNLNPVVLTTLHELRDKQHPPLTLLEAINRIGDDSGWGGRERDALGRATIGEYVVALRHLRNDSFKRFARVHFDWLKVRAPDENFEIGANLFVLACRQIFAEDPNSRLSEIIQHLFRSSNLIDKLILPTPTLGQPIALTISEANPTQTNSTLHRPAH